MKVGELQVWELVNETGMDHPFHLHGFFFQVVAIDGEPVIPTSWEDTVNVIAKGRETIACPMRWPGVASLTPMSATSPDAPSQLLAEHHGRFLNFLRRRVGDDATAEDILQDAYTKSLQRLEQVENDDSVVAWFFQLLRNAVIDYYRKAGVEKKAKAAIGREAEPSFEPELRENICKCVGAVLPTLKPEYAAIVDAVELGERPIAEVAVQSGLTTNNATVRLHRARAALRRRLIEVCGTCSTHGCLDCTCHRPT